MENKLIETFRNIDEKLMLLEDTIKGEEGNLISEIRKEISDLLEVEETKFYCAARNPNKNSAWNYECSEQCEKCSTH